jgi:hypothetical protein
VDIFKMELGKISWSGVDWIAMVQERDRWRAMRIVVFWDVTPCISFKNRHSRGT